MFNILVIVITMCLLLNGCSSNQSTNYDSDYHSSYSQNEDEYSDQEDEESENEDSSPLTFHGYTCTDDCSGHQAGYDWAEENNISDPDDCSGNSQSFIEGCQAYAEEQ